MIGINASGNHGTVLSVRGSVVDVHFDSNLPSINNLLRAGDQGQVLIEVWAQLDANRVRGIAMTPPQGLARGTRVEDTGGPLRVPVGKAIRSRMFDVFGRTIDRGAQLADVELRSIQLLPLDAAWRRRLVEIPWPNAQLAEVLGSGGASLPALVHEHLFISLYQACAESLTSENANRLEAMQRAEKNIETVSAQLQRSLNRLRQSSIDEELFDVVAGSNALSMDARQSR
jgi:ATP synthase/ATP synthase alpha/beta family, beta-barrel domain